MSQTTHIAWADHTASPWFGCTEVSPGCANCYARELTLNHKWAGWGDKSPRVRSKGFWKDAYAWDRKAVVQETLHDGMGMPYLHPRIFTSLMDWLDPQVPIEWLADFLKVVYGCQNLDWLLLTKRPENFDPLLLRIWKNHDYTKFGQWVADWHTNGNAPSNVWFGVTVENQAMADKRIPILLSIPAKVRWLSVEPLLEPICLDPLALGAAGRTGRNYQQPQIDWVVVGGESGSKRRDCGVDAIVNVADQCRAAGVPCFVKQDCAQRPGQRGCIPDRIWSMKEFPK